MEQTVVGSIRSTWHQKTLMIIIKLDREEIPVANTFKNIDYIIAVEGRTGDCKNIHSSTVME